MANHNYDLQPATLERYLAALEQLWKDLGADANATLQITISGVQVLSAAARSALPKKHEVLARMVSADLMPTHISLTIPSLQGVVFVLTDLTSTKPRVDINTQNLAAMELVSFMEVVTKYFPRSAAADIAKLIGPQLDDFYRRRDVMLQRLEDMHAKALIATNEERDRWRAEHDQREAALQASFEQKAGELQRQHVVREEELARREAELDASDARNARRKLLREIQQTLQQRSTTFELTGKTIAKRRPVFWACVLAGVLSFGVFAVLLSELLLGHDLGIPGHVGRAMSALGFVGALWFYIRWENQWFDRHAAEEFRLKRLDLDITRASWLVELSMEYGEQRQAEIPALLLEQLSRNLFIEPETKPPIAHPLEDAIRTVLAASIEGELTMPGGTKAKLGKAATKKLESESEG